jgi:hypothetical protein
MQDTVDQAAAAPRTLAQIIEDARRAVCGQLLGWQPGVGVQRYRPRRSAPGKVRPRRGLISEAGLASC